MRIVSLLSSATEIVHALELQQHLVGISHECDYPPEALHLPRVSRSRFDPAGLTSAQIDREVRRCMAEHGGVYEVDAPLLDLLEPDLVLTQAVCEVCAVPTDSVLEAVATSRSRPRVVSLDAHTVEGILGTVAQVASAAGSPERGEKLISMLRARLTAVAEHTRGRPRPRVLLLEWLDPPFTPGHWVPEMIALAGGEPLVGAAGERSRQIAWDELPRGADVLCVEPCGHDLRRAREDADRHRVGLLEVAGDAVREGKAWLLHSSFFSRSGPRIVAGVETLARVLHPRVFPPGGLEGRAEPWG